MDSSSQGFLLDTVLDYSRGFLKRFSESFEQIKQSENNEVIDSQLYFSSDNSDLTSSPSKKGINNHKKQVHFKEPVDADKQSPAKMTEDLQYHDQLVDEMKVKELKAALDECGVGYSTRARKAELYELLCNHLEDSKATNEKKNKNKKKEEKEEEEKDVDEQSGSSSSTEKKKSSPPRSKLEMEIVRLGISKDNENISSRYSTRSKDHMTRSRGDSPHYKESPPRRGRSKKTIEKKSINTESNVNTRKGRKRSRKNVETSSPIERNQSHEESVHDSDDDIQHEDVSQSDNTQSDKNSLLKNSENDIVVDYNISNENMDEDDSEKHLEGVSQSLEEESDENSGVDNDDAELVADGNEEEDNVGEEEESEEDNNFVGGTEMEDNNDASHDPAETSEYEQEEKINVAHLSNTDEVSLDEDVDDDFYSVGEGEQNSTENMDEERFPEDDEFGADDMVSEEEDFPMEEEGLPMVQQEDEDNVEYDEAEQGQEVVEILDSDDEEESNNGNELFESTSNHPELIINEDRVDGDNEEENLVVTKKSNNSEADTENSSLDPRKDAILKLMDSSRKLTATEYKQLMDLLQQKKPEDLQLDFEGDNENDTQRASALSTETRQAGKQKSISFKARDDVFPRDNAEYFGSDAGSESDKRRSDARISYDGTEWNSRESFLPSPYKQLDSLLAMAPVVSKYSQNAGHTPYPSSNTLAKFAEASADDEKIEDSIALIKDKTIFNAGHTPYPSSNTHAKYAEASARDERDESAADAEELNDQHQKARKTVGFSVRRSHMPPPLVTTQMINDEVAQPSRILRQATPYYAAGLKRKSFEAGLTDPSVSEIPLRSTMTGLEEANQLLAQENNGMQGLSAARKRMSLGDGTHRSLISEENNIRSRHSLMPNIALSTPIYPHQPSEAASIGSGYGGFGTSYSTMQQQNRINALESFTPRFKMDQFRPEPATVSSFKRSMLLPSTAVSSLTHQRTVAPYTPAADVVRPQTEIKPRLPLSYMQRRRLQQQAEFSKNAAVASKILKDLKTLSTPMETERKRPIAIDWHRASDVIEKSHAMSPEFPMAVNSDEKSSSNGIIEQKQGPNSLIAITTKRDLPANTFMSSPFIHSSMKKKSPPEPERINPTSSSSSYPPSLQNAVAKDSSTNASSTSFSTPFLAKTDVKVTEDNEFTFGEPKEMQDLEMSDEDTTASSHGIMGSGISATVGETRNNIRFMFTPGTHLRRKRKVDRPASIATSSEVLIDGHGKAKNGLDDKNASEVTPKNIWSKSFIEDGIKCGTCMVKNKKGATRCASCETPLETSQPIQVEKTCSESKIKQSSKGESSMVDIWAAVRTDDGVKCSVCMVKNKKGANKCVSCESPLLTQSSQISPNEGSNEAPKSSPATFGSSSWQLPPTSGSISSGGFTFGTASATPSEPKTSTVTASAVSGTVDDELKNTEKSSQGAFTGFKFGALASGDSAGVKQSSHSSPTQFTGFIFGKVDQSEPKLSAPTFDSGTSKPSLSGPTFAVTPLEKPSDSIKKDEISGKGEDEDKEEGNRKKRRSDESSGQVASSFLSQPSSVGSFPAVPGGFSFPQVNMEGVVKLNEEKSVTSSKPNTKTEIQFSFGNATKPSDVTKDTSFGSSTGSSFKGFGVPSPAFGMGSSTELSNSKDADGAIADKKLTNFSASKFSATGSSGTAQAPFTFGNNSTISSNLGTDDSAAVKPFDTGAFSFGKETNTKDKDVTTAAPEKNVISEAKSSTSESSLPKNSFSFGSASEASTGATFQFGSSLGAATVDSVNKTKRKNGSLDGADADTTFKSDSKPPLATSSPISFGAFSGAPSGNGTKSIEGVASIGQTGTIPSFGVTSSGATLPDTSSSGLTATGTLESPGATMDMDGNSNSGPPGGSTANSVSVPPFSVNVLPQNSGGNPFASSFVSGATPNSAASSSIAAAPAFGSSFPSTTTTAFTASGGQPFMFNTSNNSTGNIATTTGGSSGTGQSTSPFTFGAVNSSNSGPSQTFGTSGPFSGGPTGGAQSNPFGSNTFGAGSNVGAGSIGGNTSGINMFGGTGAPSGGITPGTGTTFTAQTGQGPFSGGFGTSGGSVSNFGGSNFGMGGGAGMMQSTGAGGFSLGAADKSRSAGGPTTGRRKVKARRPQ